MLQAIKIKLYPSEDQKIYINKLLGTSRFVYNQCLNYKINEYKTNNKSTNISDTNNYVKELKLEYKTCSHCGYKNNDLTLQDREWVKNIYI
jgi:putative transposase